MEQDEMRAILLAAANSSAALRGLYLRRKAMDARISLPWLCRRAKIPSSGYLSDVMHGKRTLHRKYREAIASALNLPALESRFLGRMFELENARADARPNLLRE